MFERVLGNVLEKTPLVHAITNYVTVNDCANIILASGGSPIMADNIYEVEDITSICNALVINIGTINDVLVESMIKAAKKANEIGNPVILDPVAVGASKLRTDTVNKLLKEVKFSVIRGNISEIKAVALGSNTTKGVDADLADTINPDNLEDTIAFARKLSKKTGAVIVISGAMDLVTDEKTTYLIHNGHPLMAKVTGTGCMLTTVIGSYCGANKENILEAAAAAVSSMGLSGELAYQKLSQTDFGTSTYRTYIIDMMSKMNGELLNGGIKIETR
ncbi:MAG: thiM [Clostridia bacterium]|jgi:hydroxyethylthiazole kinase|nr:thiM [Clostridia bacterium]